MRKKNKYITIALLILGLILLTGICVFLFITFKEDESEIKFNNPKKIAEKYVKAIISGDFATAYKYIDMPQDMMSSKNDFENFIKNKNYYNDIEGKKYKEIREVSTDSYQVLLDDKYGNILIINVDLIQRTINDFRVSEPDYIVNGYTVSIPRGCDLYFDNVLIDKSYISKDSSNMDVYVFPNIASSKKIAKVDGYFGSKEVELNITNLEDDDSEIEDTVITLEFNNAETKKKAYNFIKSTWNDMYTQYTKNSKVSKIRKYFDSRISDSDIKKVYTKAFDKISKGKTSIGKYDKYSMSKVVDGKKESKIHDNEFVTINFGYTLKWRWKFLNADSAVNMSMNRYSSIKLKYDGQKFTIYDIIDEGLFNYANQYTRDF